MAPLGAGGRPAGLKACDVVDRRVSHSCAAPVGDSRCVQLKDGMESL